MVELEFGIVLVLAVGLWLTGALLVATRSLGAATAPARIEDVDAYTELGLAFDGTSLAGEWQGFAVVVHPPTRESQAWTVVVELGLEVPPGFVVFDGGRPEDARPWGDSVVDRITDVHQAGRDVHVGRFVSVSGTTAPNPVSTVQSALDQGAGLAMAVRRRIFEDSARAIERLGRATTPEPGTTVEGNVNGVPIAIVLPLAQGRQWRLEVRGQLAEPLPPGTLIEGQRGRAYDTDVGDLFLDRTLDILTDAPDILRDRLARDEVRGPLLDLLCTYPGSLVTEDQIVHRVGGSDALLVNAALDRVVELARALDQSNATVRS